MQDDELRTHLSRLLVYGFKLPQSFQDITSDDEKIEMRIMHILGGTQVNEYHSYNYKSVAEGIACAHPDLTDKRLNNYFRKVIITGRRIPEKEIIHRDIPIAYANLFLYMKLIANNLIGENSNIALYEAKEKWSGLLKQFDIIRGHILRIYMGADKMHPVLQIPERNEIGFWETMAIDASEENLMRLRDDYYRKLRSTPQIIEAIQGAETIEGYKHPARNKRIKQSHSATDAKKFVEPDTIGEASSIVTGATQKTPSDCIIKE